MTYFSIVVEDASKADVFQSSSLRCKNCCRDLRRSIYERRMGNRMQRHGWSVRTYSCSKYFVIWSFVSYLFLLVFDISIVMSNSEFRHFDVFLSFFFPILLISFHYCQHSYFLSLFLFFLLSSSFISLFPLFYPFFILSSSSPSSLFLFFSSSSPYYFFLSSSFPFFLLLYSFQYNWNASSSSNPIGTNGIQAPLESYYRSNWDVLLYRH